MCVHNIIHVHTALQENFEKRKAGIEDHFAQLRNIMDQREHELIDNLNHQHHERLDLIESQLHTLRMHDNYTNECKENCYKLVRSMHT